MQDLDSYFKQKITQGISKEEKNNGSYFCYTYVNSLFRERNNQRSNMLHYELVPKANSSEGVIGVSVIPTNVV